jgi:hypothetical protein
MSQMEISSDREVEDVEANKEGRVEEAQSVQVENETTLDFVVVLNVVV